MLQRDATYNPSVSLAKLADIEAALGEAIQGKPEVVRLSLTCLLARGHLLIEARGCLSGSQRQAVNVFKIAIRQSQGRGSSVWPSRPLKHRRP